jgi:hypothetical protein
MTPKKKKPANDMPMKKGKKMPGKMPMKKGY